MRMTIHDMSSVVKLLEGIACAIFSGLITMRRSVMQISVIYYYVQVMS